MAEAKTEPKATPAEKPQPPKVETIAVERLIAESPAFLGYPVHVAAGALSAAKKKTMTVEEAKAAVSKWLKAPLEED